MRKKMEIRSGPGGKFKASWKLPQFITASTMGDQMQLLHCLCITDSVFKIRKFDEVILILRI